MRERLLLMHEVAKWKWNEGKPITDQNREKQILFDLEQRGRTYGLSRKQARDFMVAQMEAGKLVQEADFAAWKRGGQGKFSDVRDLNIALRPLIDEVSDRMLARFAEVVPTFVEEKAKTIVRQRADAILRGNGLNDTVKTAAVRPLLESQPTP